MDLSERRLADLLKAIVKQCNGMPQERPALDDPALTLCIGHIGQLLKSLEETGRVCDQHNLDSGRLAELHAALDAFFAKTVLPIVARGKSPQEVAPLQVKYGHFNPELNPERDEFLWTQFRGALASIRDYSQSLLQTIEGIAKESERPAEKDTAMTVQQAAALLGVSRSKLYELCQQGDMPHTKVGRRVTITPAQIEEYRAQSKEQQSPDHLRYV